MPDTAPSLASKVRAKYPGMYTDMSDAALEEKVLAKYPQYKDLSTPAPAAAPQPAAPKQGLLDRARSYSAGTGAGPAVTRVGLGAGEFFKDILNPGEPLIEDTNGKKSLYHKYLKDPIEEQSKQAQEAKAQGRTSEQLAHDLAAMIPLVGPIAAEAGREIGNKDYSGGAVTAVVSLLGAHGMGKGGDTIVDRVRTGIKNFSKEAVDKPAPATAAIPVASAATKAGEGTQAVEPAGKAPEAPSQLTAPEVLQEKVTQALQSAQTLPTDLRGAKPRYSYQDKQFTLNFANDLDKAAYILAQENPSLRDADYLNFYRKSTGASEGAARARGREIRQIIKGMARDAKPGELNVPIYGRHPTPAGEGARSVEPPSEPNAPANAKLSEEAASVPLSPKGVTLGPVTKLNDKIGIETRDVMRGTHKVAEIKLAPVGDSITVTWLGQERSGDYTGPSWEDSPESYKGSVGKLGTSGMRDIAREVRRLYPNKTIRYTREGGAVGANLGRQERSVLAGKIREGVHDSEQSSVPTPPKEEAAEAPIATAPPSPLEKNGPPLTDWEQFTKSVLLHRTAEGERGAAITAHAFEQAHKSLDKLPKEQQLQFAYGMEGSMDFLQAHGLLPNDPALKAVGMHARQTLTDLRLEMQKLDPNLLKHYYENYWPREWEMPGLARTILDRIRGAKSFGGNSLKGRASFMKPRTLLKENGEPVSMREAVEQHGLKPVSYNPIDIFLLKTSEMHRFISGQRILDDLKSQGIKQTFASPRQVPEGWAKYDPRYAGADQYGPAPVTETLNRFMEPGLFNSTSPLMRGAFNIARKFNAINNQALVSLAAFHAGLVTTSAIVADFGNALRDISHGDFKSAVDSLSNDSFIANIPKFNRYYNAYLKPGSMGPEIEHLIQSALEGGLKPNLADLYKTDATMAFRKALADKSPWGMAKNSIPALFQFTSGPIMRGLVPRVKLFSTLMSVKHDLEALGNDASAADQRTAFARSVQSSEDWFGQMNPDNLVISSKYWNRTLADGLGVSFKFVEFSYGTLRGMHGAAGDLAKLRNGEVTPRLAKTLVFPFVMYAMGSTVQKLMTGKAPWQDDKEGQRSPTWILDGFEPRTGKLNPDGTPERLTLPTYWRTAVQWSRPTRDLMRGDLDDATTDLGKATRGRLSGGTDTLIMWATNKDFYGREVRKPHIEDPWVMRPIEQLGDFVGAVVKSMEPISVRYATEAMEKHEGIGAAIARVGGVQPVSPTESRTLAQNKISGFLGESFGNRPLTEAEYEARADRTNVRTQVRNKDYSGIGAAMKAGDISPKQGIRFLKEAQKSLYDRADSLTPEEFMQVWDTAKPYEKLLMKNPLRKEYMRLMGGPIADRDRLGPLYKVALLEIR